LFRITKEISMPETVEQYITRIRSFANGQEPLAILAETPTRLRSLLYKLPDNRVRARPTPERWSPLEIAVHLSDVEIAIGWRVRLILGSADGVPIAPFDQDQWQQSLHYNDRDLAPTLDAFTAARDNNLHLYRSLNEAQWNKYGQHAERGKETIRAIVELNAGHDLNHLKQIEGILGK
jgi:hypothetical protein